VPQQQRQYSGVQRQYSGVQRQDSDSGQAVQEGGPGEVQAVQEQQQQQQHGHQQVEPTAQPSQSSGPRPQSLWLLLQSRRLVSGSLQRVGVTSRVIDGTTQVVSKLGVPALVSAWQP
jgi:hypothetical protein